MHAPRHFRVEDPAVLWEHVARTGFGTVFSVDGEGAPHATMAPFVVRGRRLFGHMARANPQWRTFAPARDVLCQFVGPHAYISPGWYAEDHHVPTWNVVQVQATGRPRLLEGDSARRVVEETVREFEGRRAEPWPLERMARTTDLLLTGIAAFEVLDVRVEGSWKLSQNKSEDDRAGVVAALEREGGAALAEAMRAQSPS